MSHDLLQLVRNPQCDTRLSRVMRSKNKVNGIHDHPRSCMTDSTASELTWSIQLEQTRSVSDMLDVRDIDT